jgi:hypothetical protein
VIKDCRVLSKVLGAVVDGLTGTEMRCEVSLHYESQLSTVSGPGSVVGIATGYGLDGPGFEPRWGGDFPHLSRPALGPNQRPVQWVSGPSRG